ncbi:MAG: hypothetical protein ACRC2O_14710, partial [Chitinophagaceae bacterium]
MNFKFYLIAIFLFLSYSLTAQNLSGQWTGGFVSTGDTWGRQTEYVLELEVSGTMAKGHSYTYFIIGGKRHYVICRLSGTYDKGSKSVTVSEVEKVKSNTPPDFKDCFQTHSLTFLKQGEKEVLEGRWKPATIKDNCGTGETLLERKALVKISPAKTVTPADQQKTTTKAPSTAPPNTKTAPANKPSTTTIPPKT